MDNTKGIKVYDTVWVDMSNWSGIPPHESGYAVVVDMLVLDEVYTGMCAVRFLGSDDVIIVNGRRITPINEDEDTQEDTMHDKHYRDSVVEPILVMQALFSHDEFIGFLKGNILKYRLRMGHKDTVQKEMDKIKRYEKWLSMVQAGKRIEL